MTLDEIRIEKNKHSAINVMHGAILFIVPVKENEQNDFRNRLIARLMENETLEQIAEKINYLDQLYEDNYLNNTFELRYLRGMSTFLDEYDLQGNPIK